MAHFIACCEEPMKKSLIEKFSLPGFDDDVFVILFEIDPDSVEKICTDSIS